MLNQMEINRTENKQYEEAAQRVRFSCFCISTVELLEVCQRGQAGLQYSQLTRAGQIERVAATEETA
jgi:hypothetical protein